MSSLKALAVWHANCCYESGTLVLLSFRALQKPIGGRMTARNFHVILFLVLTLILAGRLAVATENYCTDPESWMEWEALVGKYPNDSDLQALHALRIGLCLKIERGDLTVEQATDIFEGAREAILEIKKAEMGKREKLGL